jgi:LysM repeat protein
MKANPKRSEGVVKTPRDGGKRTIQGVFLCLVALTISSASVPAAAAAEYRVLPHATVLLDGRPVDVGPVVQDATAYLVPVGKAVKALTRGQAVADPDDARPFRIRRGEQVLVELPADGAESTAVVLGRPLYAVDTPQRVRLPDQPEQLMMDLKVLAGLLGITAEHEGATFSLWTPEYWCEQIGLGRAAGQRTVRNLSLLPDIGVSPPAKSLVIWVRPRERAFVQIYKLSGGRPEPLLGVNQFDRPVTHPNPPLGTPRAWPADANAPVRVDTLFYDEPPEPGPTRHGTYVALVTRREPPEGDILRAVRSGQIPPDDWCVVGVRQRVVRGVILYEPHAAAPGDTPAGIARRFRMPLAMLEDLNGLRPGDPLAPGAKVVVIRGVDVEERQRREKAAYVKTGYYAVLPGDTVASLARRCGVSAEAFLDANNTVPPGAELEPGEIVTLVKPVRPVPTNPTSSRTSGPW